MAINKILDLIEIMAGNIFMSLERKNETITIWDGFAVNFVSFVARL